MRASYVAAIALFIMIVPGCLGIGSWRWGKSSDAAIDQLPSPEETLAAWRKSKPALITRKRPFEVNRSVSHSTDGDDG